MSRDKLRAKAIVLRWRDGDTLEALVDCPTCRVFQKRAIRLARIESDEPHGATKERAAFVAAELDKLYSMCWAFVQPVKSSDDLHGRIVAEVWVGNKNLSDEAVRLGLSWLIGTRQTPVVYATKPE